MKRLPRSFYTQPVIDVARQLLGQVVRHQLHDGEIVTGMIIETEAYVGPEDKASHAYQSRRTARNESMYLSGGHAYVYFTYGMHHCFNIVTGPKHHPQAVLIRALEPIEGVETMLKLRSGKIMASRLKPTELCSGPAKLCQAMQIDLSHDGVDLLAGGELTILHGTTKVEDSQIVSTSRVGVHYAGEWAEKPLRFYIKQNRHVSRK